jgi:hypothetical protein
VALPPLADPLPPAVPPPLPLLLLLLELPPPDELPLELPLEPPLPPPDSCRAVSSGIAYCLPAGLTGGGDDAAATAAGQVAKSNVSAAVLASSIRLPYSKDRRWHQV